jgi:hypothetical protein
MNSNGVIFKRCGCRHPQTRRLLETACPRLSDRGHGSWYFHCTVTTMWGEPERVRRGGYATSIRPSTLRSYTEHAVRPRRSRRPAVDPLRGELRQSPGWVQSGKRTRVQRARCDQAIVLSHDRAVDRWALSCDQGGVIAEVGH